MPYISFNCSKPPSVNACYANITGKGRVKTVAYKTWSLENAWKLKNITRGFEVVKVPFYTIFELPKLHTSADGDNLIKPLFDLMQEIGVIKNDSLQNGHYVYHGTNELIKISFFTDFFMFDVHINILNEAKKKELIRGIAKK